MTTETLKPRTLEKIAMEFCDSPALKDGPTYQATLAILREAFALGVADAVRRRAEYDTLHARYPRHLKPATPPPEDTPRRLHSRGPVKEDTAELIPGWVSAQAPEDTGRDDDLCQCGAPRDAHGGPYGDGAYEATGCEAFTRAPASPEGERHE